MIKKSTKVPSGMKAFYSLIILFLAISLQSTRLNAQIIPADSAALVTIYNNAAGMNWGSNWTDPAVHPSLWDGVTVENGRVVELNMNSITNNGLVGTISAGLHELTALRFLEIRELENLDDIIDFENLPNLTNIKISACPDLELMNFLGLIDLVECDIRSMPLFHPLNLENSTELEILTIYESNLETLFNLDQLAKLVTLNVEFNSLTSIPNLANNLLLTNLDIGDNPLVSMPELSQLVNLETITFQNLGLEELPDLNFFPNLTSLIASRNQLTEFPDLSNNVLLEDLNLSNNLLTSTPSLIAFSELVTLTIINNQLTEIGDLTDLDNLRFIRIGRNNLKSLPGLLTLDNLENLTIDQNEFDVLPDLSTITTLRSLNVSFNNLTELPSILNGSDNFSMFIQGNNIPFRELERIDDFGLTNLNLNYNPQTPPLEVLTDGLPIYGDSFSITVPLDGDASLYTWLKDGEAIPGLTDLEDPTLQLDSVNLLDKGYYSCEVSNSTYTGYTYMSDSLFIQVLGEDSLGGLYIYDQLMIQYDTAATQAFRDSLRQEHDASVLDQCQCGQNIELWQFDSLAFKPITLLIDGEFVTLTDPDEIKKRTKRRTRVNEADFNYPMNLSALNFKQRSRIDRDKIMLAPPSPPAPPADLVTLALIDTGLDSLHNLEDYYWVNNEINDADNCLDGDINGYNFVDKTSNFIEQDNGHGTHLAGIITENLLPQTDFDIMTAKTFGDDGYGELFDAICAIYYGIEGQADIYNLSWGYYGAPVTLLETALSKTDALVVSSAGNGIAGIGVDISQDSLMHFPGSFDLDNMITVAAWDEEKDAIAPFSNYSDSLVHIAALGVDIRPALNYDVKSGTSQAAAAVSAAALCLKLDNPTWGYAELKEELLKEVNTRFSLEDKTTAGGFLGSCVDGMIVSTEETTQESDTPIAIHPNPFDALVQVVSTKEIKDYALYDMHGNMALQGKSINSTHISIDTKNLVSGMYILSILIDGKWELEKLVKQ